MTQLLFVLLEFASQKTIICPFLKEKYGDRNTSIFTASGLLLLEQGQFVMSQRLGELAFSPSGEAPRDGNCMMHSLNESERRPSGLCYVSTRLAVENL